MQAAERAEIRTWLAQYGLNLDVTHKELVLDYLADCHPTRLTTLAENIIARLRYQATGDGTQERERQEADAGISLAVQAAWKDGVEYTPVLMQAQYKVIAVASSGATTVHTYSAHGLAQSVAWRLSIRCTVYLYDGETLIETLQAIR